MRNPVDSYLGTTFESAVIAETTGITPEQELNLLRRENAALRDVSASLQKCCEEQRLDAVKLRETVTRQRELLRGYAIDLAKVQRAARLESKC